MNRPLLSILLASFALAGCGGISVNPNSNSSSSLESSSAGSVSSSVDSASSSESFSSASSEASSISSAIEESSSYASSSIPFETSSEELSTLESEEDPPISESSTSTSYPEVDSTLAQQLVINAPNIDQALHAKKANIEIEADGYDGGVRYHQESAIEETSYANDITIASGSIRHQVGETVFEDAFDEVRTIKSNLYIRLREYQNKVFEDESEQRDLLSDIGDIQIAHYSVSCGAGYKAYLDLYQAVSMGAEMRYSCSYDSSGFLRVYFYAYGEYEASNQAYVATFSYIFDSPDTGRMLGYGSNQAYYPLDRYLKDDYFEATYSAVETTTVEFGALETFDGELPIDLDSGFVQRIVLSAAKTTIEVDEVIALRSEVFPNTAVDQTLRFSSSDESVALVNKDGRVKGVAAGVATITATNIASGVTGSIEITVTKKAQIDPGQDEEKTDLKEAIEKSWNQIFLSKDLDWDQQSITGMLIDSDAKLRSGYFSTLSVSAFFYNPNTRIATYVGDDLQQVALNILPFLDNENDNLTNDYRGNSWDTYIYHEVVSSMEIVLRSDNTIDYIHFHGRTDGGDLPSGVSFASLTNETVKSISIGANPYEKDMYYVSQGFASYDD